MGTGVEAEPSQDMPEEPESAFLTTMAHEIAIRRVAQNKMHTQLQVPNLVQSVVHIPSRAPISHLQHCDYLRRNYSNPDLEPDVVAGDWYIRISSDFGAPAPAASSD